MNIDISKAWATIQGWINGLITLLPNLAVAIIAFILFYFLGKGVKQIVLNLTNKHQRSHHVGYVVGRLSHGLIAVLGFFIALMIVVPSITAAQLVGALGVSSIAIGFAFKEILQNFLSGIIILITQPFRIGDRIVVSSYEGTVMNIETRATTIRTYDNFVVVIPNSTLFTGSVTVLTALGQQRTQYEFHIKYSQDVDRAKQIILQVAANTEGVLPEPPPDVMIVDAGDDKITLRGRWWTAVSETDWLKVRDQVLDGIKKRFDKERLSLDPKEREAEEEEKQEETVGPVAPREEPGKVEP